MRGQAFAVGSGLLASVASMCGKVAMARHEAHSLCEQVLFYSISDKSTEICEQASKHL